MNQIVRPSEADARPSYFVARPAMARFEEIIFQVTPAKCRYRHSRLFRFGACVPRIFLAAISFGP